MFDMRRSLVITKSSKSGAFSDLKSIWVKIIVQRYKNTFPNKVFSRML